MSLLSAHAVLKLNVHPQPSSSVFQLPSLAVEAGLFLPPHTQLTSPPLELSLYRYQAFPMLCLFLSR